MTELLLQVAEVVLVLRHALAALADCAEDPRVLPLERHDAAVLFLEKLLVLELDVGQFDDGVGISRRLHKLLVEMLDGARQCRKLLLEPRAFLLDQSQLSLNLQQPRVLG